MSKRFGVVTIICLIVAFNQWPACNSNLSLWNLNSEGPGPQDINVYQQMLEGIQKERPFDTILIRQPNPRQDPRLEIIYRLPGIKVIAVANSSFPYKQQYNADSLLVVIMSDTWGEDFFQATAQTLDHIRQTRILAVAVNVSEKQQQFQQHFLQQCRRYKMTNVLLMFLPSHREVSSSQYYIVKPYPVYHWDLSSVESNQGVYYPQHWRNMHNATLITYTTQVVPENLVYFDEQGNMRINGVTARMVLLFAERFNASLEMYKPVEVGEFIHSYLINNWTDENKLDIPMVLNRGIDKQSLHLSDVYDWIEVMLVVPCAVRLTIRELYEVLLNEIFFGCVIACTLLLSIIHSLIDYCFDGLLNRLNFVLSDKILPGVLGQSFAARSSPWRGLKIVYLLLFFAGVNITAQFSAHMNTLFTSPPHHAQIETFGQLRRSSVKILLDEIEATDINIWLPTIGNAYTVSTSHFVVDCRTNLNTSYGYLVSSSVWNVISQQQEHLFDKLLCTHDTLIIAKPLWSFGLQAHSPYMEALNYLIHRVHELGLMKAWYTSTFLDMVKLKRISLNDPSPEKGPMVLTVNDLFWIWMVAAIGLMISTLVFLMELFVGWRESMT